MQVGGGWVRIHGGCKCEGCERGSGGPGAHAYRGARPRPVLRAWPGGVMHDQSASSYLAEGAEDVVNRERGFALCQGVIEDSASSEVA